jgi:hypothetical protein
MSLWKQNEPKLNFTGTMMYFMKNIDIGEKFYFKGRNNFAEYMRD